MNGWQRIVAVVIALWVIGVGGTAVYEYATERDGIFTGQLLARATGRVSERDAGSAVQPSKAARKSEPAIATERVVHWKMLLGALSFPFLVLLAVTLLSRALTWIGNGFDNDGK